jgi:hypothetical protein
MRLMASPPHMLTKYNTVGGITGMGNRAQLSEFQATEEELAASEYELSKVEAQLLHLNDKKTTAVGENRKAERCNLTEKDQLAHELQWVKYGYIT